jgi:hypothetical protein
MAYIRRKFNVRDLVLWVFLSYVIVTVLNVLISRSFPEVPILKSGFALILIMAAVLITLLFSVIYDKRIDRIEVWMVVLTITVMVGLWWVTKTYIPEIYSLVPQSTKQITESAFSILK